MCIVQFSGSRFAAGIGVIMTAREWQGRLISVLEGGYDVPPDAARKSRSGSVNMHPPPNGALASS